ncbi:hypothetical protein DFQ28_007531 [Apophysomyces sp. BC1034]|nr:hypothetical protein DFQ30_007491 [Apophysomyces sp. BC1015]KAG0182033.1 hypothetical protein DFQ29_006013 [Apophysomyces sp. BC1021]KAG0186612.1 hypothetical protein DFQ28_007531 [Apophysomyces sp. BC1034]
MIQAMIDALQTHAHSYNRNVMDRMTKVVRGGDKTRRSHIDDWVTLVVAPTGLDDDSDKDKDNDTEDYDSDDDP